MDPPPPARAPNRRKRKISSVGKAIAAGARVDPSLVIMSNVVATASFGVEIDLREVAWECHGEFNPDSFAAVSLRLHKPRTTALVFGSGRIVCTGASSEASAVEAVHRYYAMVQKVVKNAMCINIRIQNIVSTGSHGRCINIPEMYKHFQLSSTYDPELFPGIRVLIKTGQDKAGAEGRATQLRALLFGSGNSVLTGAKSRQEIADGWRELRSVVEPFLIN